MAYITNIARSLLGIGKRPFSGIAFALLLAVVIFGTVVVLTYPLKQAHGQEEYDWRSDWTVRDGYTIEVDTDGYDFPTAIAFVPNPGDGPQDPLYFITELRGAVKVVTNDRTVHTFADDFFELGSVSAYADEDSKAVGLAGVCLEPIRGYVYVTFAYHDHRRILRNNIVRFQSTPGSFSLQPESQIDFRDIFVGDLSNASHQIGSCQILDDNLFVGVGDGEQVNMSQRMDSTLGKVLRMTLDGKPVDDNPFRESFDVGYPPNYIWALGFRNPFGLKIVQGRLFVSETGPRMDRFLEVKEGKNYLWDGSNTSMGTNAIASIWPGFGMSQNEHNAGDNTDFPVGFYANVSGSPVFENAAVAPPRILYIGYDLESSDIQNVPEPFVRYRGWRNQVLVGVAFGPDGLYYSPLFPNEGGLSAVFRVTPDTSAAYPFTIENDLNVDIIFNDHSCLQCHSFDEGLGGNVGPNLFRPSLVARLEKRLNSESYLEAMRKLDESDEDAFASYSATRQQVLDAEGSDRVRLWVRNRIMDPKFDNPNARMPNLGLSQEEADVIADYVMRGSAGTFEKPKALVRKVLPSKVDRQTVVGVSVIAFIGGMIFFSILFFGLRFVRRSRG